MRDITSDDYDGVRTDEPACKGKLLKARGLHNGLTIEIWDMGVGDARPYASGNLWYGWSVDVVRYVDGDEQRLLVLQTFDMDEAWGAFNNDAIVLAPA